MSDENGTVESPPESNSGSSTNSGPQTTQSAASVRSEQVSHNIDFSELIEAVNSIPERITQSLQEALKPPKNPAPKEAPKVEPEVKQEAQRKKTFAERWFG